MPPRWNENRLTAKLGIDYPVIQGPLGGLSSQKLTAAVSNFGGLGSFGAHGLTPEAIKGAIARDSLRYIETVRNELVGHRWKTKVLEHLVKMHSTGALRHSRPISQLWERLVRRTNLISPIRFATSGLRVLLDEKVPVFSFIFGIPPKEVPMSAGRKASSRLARPPRPKKRRRFKSRSGRHRRFRLRSRRTSRLIPPSRGGFTYRHLFARPSGSDTVNVPVIAAGGIADARGVIAALALGAEAVQMGTVFLACEESGASLLHRQALRGKKPSTPH